MTWAPGGAQVRGTGEKERSEGRGLGEGERDLKGAQRADPGGSQSPAGADGGSSSVPSFGLPQHPQGPAPWGCQVPGRRR